MPRRGHKRRRETVVVERVKGAMGISRLSPFARDESLVQQ